MGTVGTRLLCPFCKENTAEVLEVHGVAEDSGRCPVHDMEFVFEDELLTSSTDHSPSFDPPVSLLDIKRLALLFFGAGHILSMFAPFMSWEDDFGFQTHASGIALGLGPARAIWGFVLLGALYMVLYRRASYAAWFRASRVMLLIMQCFGLGLVWFVGHQAHEGMAERGFTGELGAGLYFELLFLILGVGLVLMNWRSAR